MIFNYDKLSFQVLNIGIFTHDPGCFDVKARPFSAISLRLSGSGRFNIDGKTLYSEVGDVLFIPAGMTYTVEYSTGQSIVVHLQGCNYLEAESIRTENIEQIKNAFERMLKHWNVRHSHNRAKADIYGILELLSLQNKSLKNDEVLSQCLCYIEENCFSNALSVEDICQKLFISHSTLQRSFIKHMGTSPRNYIIKLRMSKALDMLISGRYTVKEVSAACGFTDEKYFSRVFRKTYGIAPSNVKSKAALQ